MMAPTITNPTANNNIHPCLEYNNCFFSLSLRPKLSRLAFWYCFRLANLLRGVSGSCGCPGVVICINFKIAKTVMLAIKIIGQQILHQTLLYRLQLVLVLCEVSVPEYTGYLKVGQKNYIAVCLLNWQNT